MAKAVLISIRPEWVKKIVSGEKTVEIRKNRPKLKTPFKCYIYCTKGNANDPGKLLEIHAGDGKIRKANGRVAGEFTCDAIDEITIIDTPVMEYICVNGKASITITSDSCMDISALSKYADGKNLYGWRISDLEIYDIPKDLPEFHAWKKCNSCRKSGYESTACAYDETCIVPAVITRPPQSWCYVEELENG